MAEYPPLHITSYWQRLNDSIIALVDCVPDDKFNWSPTPEEWNFRGVFLHLCGSWHHWMENAIRDAEPTPDFVRLGQTRDGLKEQIQAAWTRGLGLLSDPAALATRYASADASDPWSGDGNWIAFRRLEHDFLHRAQILRYLKLLDVDIPKLDTAWG